VLGFAVEAERQVVTTVLVGLEVDANGHMVVDLVAGNVAGGWGSRSDGHVQCPNLYEMWVR